jgi:NADPH:quinone reductase-like Zn-dependent oxidoreductase
MTTASPKHEAFLKSLGATHVFDRRLPAEDVKAAVSKVATSPIKVVYDAISLTGTQQIGWSLLGSGGTLILTLPASVKEDEGKERKTIFTYGNPHAEENKLLCSGSWAKLGKWLEDGSIKVA